MIERKPTILPGETVFTPAGDGDAPPSALTPGALLGGRYRIEAALGVGGMAEVYRATDTHGGGPLVLKVVRPEILGPETERLLIDEARLAGRVRHPNVVAVHRVDRADGLLFLAMEHVEGRTLRDWLRERQRGGTDTPVAAAVGVAAAILSGLEAAHAEGVIHRDLKPENVMLTGAPEAGDFGLRILDFGVARALGAAPAVAARHVGSADYMAPEQRDDPEHVGPAADLYAVGLILAEMLLGVRPGGPWRAPSAQRPDLPPALDAVIERAIAQRPRARYASAADFSRAVATAVGGGAAANGEGRGRTDAEPQSWGDAWKAIWRVDADWATAAGFRRRWSELLDPRNRRQIWWLAILLVLLLGLYDIALNGLPQ